MNVEELKALYSAVYDFHVANADKIAGSEAQRDVARDEISTLVSKCGFTLPETGMEVDETGSSMTHYMKANKDIRASLSPVQNEAGELSVPINYDFGSMGFGTVHSNIDSVLTEIVVVFSLIETHGLAALDGDAMMYLMTAAIPAELSAQSLH